jgi:hypothetical protein
VIVARHSGQRLYRQASWHHLRHRYIECYKLPRLPHVAKCYNTAPWNDIANFRGGIVKKNSACRADNDELRSVVLDPDRPRRPCANVYLSVLAIQMMRRAAKDNERSMLIFEKLLLQNDLNLGVRHG